MTSNVKSIMLAGLLASATLAPVVAVAANAVIENAKGQCIVGEQADGYLGIVDASRASDAIRREVRDVNQQRKAVYADLARRNGVSTDVTAKLTAEKLLTQARQRGHCYRDPAGRWVGR
ncbi:MAG: YdbL family protein [Pseudomonadota bacterium]